MSFMNRKMFNRNARNKLNAMGGVANFFNGGSIADVLQRRGIIPTPELLQTISTANKSVPFVNTPSRNPSGGIVSKNRLPTITLSGSDIKKIAEQRLNRPKFKDQTLGGTLFKPEEATSPGGAALSQLGKSVTEGLIDAPAKGVASLMNIFKPFSGMTPGVQKKLETGEGNIDLKGVDITQIPNIQNIPGYENFGRPIGMVPGRITKVVPEGSKGPKPFPKTPADIISDDTNIVTDMSKDQEKIIEEQTRMQQGQLPLVKPEGDVTKKKEKETKTETLTSAEQKDDEAAFEGTVEPQAKDAVQVAEVIQSGKPEDQQAELKQLMQEFKQNAPEYKGVDKSLAIAKIFFSMAAGQSPDAITNIAGALQKGADDFIKDKKSRDAFDRQVDLAALQYGVGEIGKRRAQDRLDQRTFTDFVVGKGGLTYKGVTYEEGDTFRFTNKDYMDNGGKLPKNIMDKTFATKYQAAINSKNKSFNDLQKDLLKKKFLTTEAQRKYKNDYADAISKASSAETAGSLLESVIMRAPEIVGGGPAFKQFGSQFFAFFGTKPPKGFDAKQIGVNDLRAALQDVVKVTLGSTQSANSISNRDVEFLIQGFLSDGIIKRNQDGTLDFSLAGTTQKTFINSLQKGLKAVRRAQMENLNAMTAIEKELVGAYTFTGGSPQEQILAPLKRGKIFKPGATLPEGQTTKTLSFNEKDNLYFVPKG